MFAQETEPVYTPAEAGDRRVSGYYDSTASLGLELAGRYNSGAMNADAGSLEIVAYNPASGYAYAVSGVKGRLIAVDLNGSLDGDKVISLSGTEYDVKSLVDGFAYGDMTSVAVSPDGSRLAVAIQAENYAENGVVALFACENDGSLTLLSTVVRRRAARYTDLCGRFYDSDVSLQVSPEGLCFVPASDSRTGNALILAACEVSGTLAVYECSYNETDTPADASDYDYLSWIILQLYNQEYSITASVTDGGTITPDGISKVKYSNSITYTITPDEGYEIADVLVDGESVGAVSEYTLKNIKADHTISATFVKTAWENRYTDVSEAAWYYEDIAFVSEKGLMLGTDEDGTKFSPDAIVNRAMLVTVLWRLEGSPVTDSPAAFSDIPSDEWYAAAVNWADLNGIVNGIGSDISDLTEGADRAELAAYLRRVCEEFIAE